MSSSGTETHGLPPPVSCVIPSFDGTLIHYDVYDRPGRFLALVVPGFWRERRHPAMVRLASLLHGQGYRVAVVDTRGHGDSGGTYGFNLHEHYDVAAVANDLANRLSFEKVILVGLSYGGAISISTAARHDLPIGGLLLISAVADFAMITPRLNPFTMHRHIAFRQALRRPRFEWRLRHRSSLRAADDVRNVHAPICLIHVKNDWLIGHHHSLAIYEAANEPKELHLLDVAGNYHADRIFTIASETVTPIVCGFLDRHAPPAR
jgi:pimeloyl-ACP methyl ester carboxylesterase